MENYVDCPDIVNNRYREISPTPGNQTKPNHFNSNQSKPVLIQSNQPILILINPNQL